MLSDAKIKTLKPKEKVYRILDAERLYIEVRPSGKKIWRFKYVLNGKEGSISLGEYPVISLLEARRLKQAEQVKLSQGLNPSDEKKKAKQKESSSTTFKDIAQEYKEKKLVNRSVGYINQFDSAMEKDIFKVIGAKDISKVTSADVLKIMESTLKRVRSQTNYGSGEVTAIQNRKFIGLVMRYAIVTLRAEYDPTYAVKDYVTRPDVEHAKPIDRSDMSKLRTNLENYNGSTTVKNAGLCLLYSMLRTIEIRRMRWSFVDFEQRIITFPISSKRNPSERTTKKNRLHIVPFSKQIEGILKEQLKITGGQEYVFPSVYKTGMLSATTLNRMLDYIGLSEVTAHDFRATASTMLNEKGYSQDWIEKQLAHAEENKTRASYNHAQYLEDRRKMLQDWADMVDGWK
ncbi:tyrosine-type recombinase/integrase [Acinetobacter pollinis]|uniref:tyrosine-type recombinase/integrase n=1 Tax=Acinetobacter pollinis TaxID=2605270 RepID=UPI0018C205B6|nr:tyrosine-type recombinase/integrase [Acinetobacter pollinis]MBF7694260.1 tyrosine-type recombinase/integrase [Acinetobacter pollinis]MBF7700894.1 tyrosine-type recombinase/integrase [Acinetobacter pollinis]